MFDKGDLPNVTLGVSSLIGTRPEQQDSVYAEILEDSVVACLCDGMGGLDKGELASQTAIFTFAEDYDKWDRSSLSVPDFFRQEVVEMDMVVSELKGDDGEAIRAGTTASAVIIRNKELYWMNVGDSRVYIIRGDEIISATREHNYRMRLDEALKAGTIDEEVYKREESQAEALISYIGMGNITLMDINSKPFRLQSGDIVLVCSDGLYRTLSDSEIHDIVSKHLPNTQVIADTLTETAIFKSFESQDNTSAVVIHCL
ncbi:MAG: protein phosphatase 2C domain-containing protein [Lachnospiraceae bacterium]|nr:protein phosphatase 2C domain-containing protein [Lachnospiraceae bacterium]